MRNVTEQNPRRLTMQEILSVRFSCFGAAVGLNWHVFFVHVRRWSEIIIIGRLAGKMTLIILWKKQLRLIVINGKQIECMKT